MPLSEKKQNTLSYQAATEEAWTGALLLTRDAATADAVVDQLVFLSQAVAGVASGQYDSQLVLSLFSIETHKLALLLCRRGNVAFLGLWR